MDNLIKEVLYTEDQIKEKVRELAKQISKDYEGKKVLCIGILKGSVVFLSDIIREMDVEVEIDFMAVSSYGHSTKSSGVVRILKDLNYDIEGKDVLIIEDIIDTGTTLKYLCEYLKGRKPKTLKVCCLLDKPERRNADIKSDYTGFVIPDYFIVGYGIDYADRFRQLPYIGVPKEEVYSDK
ncbi:hypoxanthine phosphoribosyltransferase [Clostridium cylindrosporum]|uniref:Hypoxanthine phosphoribosyltransferase n=1 Tax=Clostridium cylindrosporum DSM 605 TaxID=1121307 RepID=A0A0J8D7M8_CLOCY|nr:hypoxanthine phosphoribosyltransferase [Clostridium cylindrosporum]KMT22040.1 bifunctional protein TilS/HprT [Clostridium cylindrosporum DSM 605]